MLELHHEGTPPTVAKPVESAGFSAVRDLIHTRPDEFARALGELYLIGTNVQLFSDPNARADLLALDPQGAAVVVAVERDGEHSLLEHGLMCAGLVAGWQPDFFFLYPTAGPPVTLRAFLQVPDEQVNRQQRVVLVAHSHEYAVYGAAKWLAQRHGIEIWCVQARVDAETGRLDLKRLGSDPSQQQEGSVETVRVIFPQASGSIAEIAPGTEAGLPQQPALDPLTAAVTRVCHSRTIWQPEAESPASHSIEGRLEQILDEELQKAGTATPEAPAVEAPAAEAPAAEAPTAEHRTAAPPDSPPLVSPAAAPGPATRPAAEPASPAQPTPTAPERRERREVGGRKSSWIAGIVLLTAVIVFAAAILVSVWRSSASPASPSAGSAQPANTAEALPPQVPGIFSSYVRDAATGRAIAGAQVYYAGQTLLADAAGGFQVQIEPDEPKVLVKAVGYRQTSSSTESKEPIALEPIEVRGFYVSHSHVADPFRRESILKLIRGTAANAVVLGVKDVTGSLNVAVDHPLAREVGAASRAELVGMARQVAAWKAERVYTIALLALFKDDLLARKKPELGLRSILSRQPIVDPDGIAWADPASPDVRDYNIAVAKAAAEAGFDEIHFDFIRYPAEAPSDEGGSAIEYKRRLKTLVGFLRNASDALAPYNVYVSASVFGSVCSMPRAGVIGQKIEDFASNVDYVSPMLYPSYFEPGQRYPDPLRQSYQLVLDNLGRAASRLNGDSRKLRPWLQNFPDSASPDEAIGAGSILNQVKAAEDAHASGWMLWDSRNRYRNTTEAITMLRGQRDRAEGGRPGTVSGGALPPIAPGGGEPTANPSQQIRLLGVLLLAGCCLGVLYGAVRAAWLFHAWSRGGPSRQPHTARPASGARALLRGSVSWAAFPKLAYDDPQFTGPLQRSAGRGRVSS